LCVVVDKPHHAGLSGCSGSANGHVTVPLRVALSAIAWLQQVLHLVEHQVVSRSEGDPLNAASITARSRGGDLLGLTGNSERELTVSGL
jgi:hypothetical protein